MRRACGLALGLLLMASATIGQESPPALDLNDGNLDLAVPEAPAFTVLDLTPETIVRPATPREAALSLLNGVDRQGNLQTGLAVDTAPYLIARANGARPMTLAEYQDNYGQRFLARLGASLATVKGSDDADESVRLALGFRAVPLDYGDPRNDSQLLTCLLDAQRMAISAISAESALQSLALDNLALRQLRDMSAEDRHKALQAEKPAAVAALVFQACTPMVLRESALDALGAHSANEVFSTLEVDEDIFCSLPPESRAAQLATNPKAQALAKRIEPDFNLSDQIDALCLSVVFTPPPESQLRTTAELFTTLQVDPVQICRLQQDEIANALKDKPGVDVVGDRLVAAFEKQIEGQLVPALVTATAAGDRCREEARARNWNATAWEIGGAPVWMSDNGKIQDLSEQGGAVWNSFSIDFAQVPIINSVLTKEATDHSQGVLHLRYTIDEMVADSENDGAFIEQNELLFGGRLRVGWDSFAASLEGLYVHTDPTGVPASSGARYSVGADVRLASNLWLTASVGGQSGQGNDDQAFVLGSLKYGFSGERTIPLGPE